MNEPLGYCGKKTNCHINGFVAILLLGVVAFIGIKVDLCPNLNPYNTSLLPPGKVQQLAISNRKSQKKWKTGWLHCRA